MLNKRFRAGTTNVTPQLATPNYFVALELYMVKLDTQGQGLWGQYLSYTAYQSYVTSGSAAHTYGDVALAVNAQGDVLCARIFMGSTTQSGHTFVAKSGTDIVVLAYSGQGAYKWSTQVGGPDPIVNSDQIHGLAVDNAGNCYLGMLLTGMQSLTQYAGTSNIYYYFTSFAPDGSMRWVRPTGAIVLDVAARAADEVWVTGYFEYTQKFDSFSLTSPTGSYSPFLAWLTAVTPPPPSPLFPTSSPRTATVLTIHSGHRVCLLGPCSYAYSRVGASLYLKLLTIPSPGTPPAYPLVSITTCCKLPAKPP